MLTLILAQINSLVIKENIKNLLPSQKSTDGAQKRGSHTLIWGQIHFKTWAYLLPPMFIKKFITNHF
jgi:hypothetical protein